MFGREDGYVKSVQPGSRRRKACPAGNTVPFSVSGREGGRIKCQWLGAVLRIVRPARNAATGILARGRAALWPNPFLDPKYNPSYIA